MKLSSMAFGRRVVLCFGLFMILQTGFPQALSPEFQRAKRFFSAAAYSDAYPIFKVLNQNFPRDARYAFYLGACRTALRRELPIAIENLELARAKGYEAPVSLWLAIASRLSYDFERSISLLQNYPRRNFPRQTLPENPAEALMRSGNGRLFRQKASNTPVLCAYARQLNGVNPLFPEGVSLIGMEPHPNPQALPQDTFIPFEVRKLAFRKGDTLLFSIQSKSKGLEIKSAFFNDSKKGSTPGFEKLNFSGNDLAPVFHPSKAEVWFSSNRKEGAGGYDLFIFSQGNEKNRPAEIRNPGFPVNSPFDEIMALFSENGDTIWVLTNRFLERDQWVWLAFGIEEKTWISIPESEQVKRLSGSQSPEILKYGFDKHTSVAAADGINARQTELLKIADSLRSFLAQAEPLADHYRRFIMDCSKERDVLVNSLKFISDDSINSSIGRSIRKWEARKSGEEMRLKTVWEIKEALSLQLAGIDKFRLKLQEMMPDSDSVIVAEDLSRMLGFKAWLKEWEGSEFCDFSLWTFQGDFPNLKLPGESKSDGPNDHFRLHQGVFKDWKQFWAYGRVPIPGLYSDTQSGSFAQAALLQLPIESPNPTTETSLEPDLPNPIAIIHSRTGEVLPELCLEPGRFFSVQLGNFSDGVFPEAFHALDSLLHTTSSMGIHRYSFGRYSTYASARNALKFIDSLGFHDAFIIAMEDGRQIPVQSALRQSGEKWRKPVPRSTETQKTEFIERSSGMAQADVFLSLQITASSSRTREQLEREFAAIAGDQPLFILESASGILSVAVGRFYQTEAAYDLKAQLKDAGFPEVFLIASDGKKKIPLQEAKKSMGF